jgi:hypothetical protein
MLEITRQIHITYAHRSHTLLHVLSALLNYSEHKRCPAFDGIKMKYYISEMKFGIKLSASSFSIVTLPVPPRLV